MTTRRLPGLRRPLFVLLVAVLLPACGGGGSSGSPGPGPGPAPLAFQLLTPANAEALAPTRPHFSWEVALGAFSYRIEISNSLNFTTIVLDQVVTTTTWSPALPLAGSTPHWWRVRAVNFGGETFATNNPRSFTTVNTANVWGTQGMDARHGGSNPFETGQPPLTFAWSTSLGSGALNPVVYEAGRVFVTPYQLYATPAAVTALDASTGASLWSHNFGSIFSVGQPAVSGGSVLLQTSNNSIAPASNAWSLDAAGGTVNWSTAIGSQWENFWAPIVVGNTIYSNGGYYGGLYGRNFSTGVETFFLGNPLEQFDEWSPAYDNGVLYTFIKGSFRAHNPANGAILWTRTVPWVFFTYDMKCSPVLDGTRAYVIAPPNLHAINLTTQLVDWTVSGLNFSGTVALDNGVVFALSGGTLHARDAGSGASLWTFAGDAALNHAPAIANGYLYVSSNANTYAVRLSDHVQVWTAAVGGWLSVAGGKLFIARPDGVLTAYSLTP
ncbi:MAG TPA: PQQ-binding-like beta-propeller repeat protein [Planctomycetota bacterium]|nr:PQQ-binding-like beta-propeller repeat protein [Planctomycetota bacterium]